MLELGRQARGLGTKVLLQPFAYGIANRSARLAIDWFAVVGGSTIHDAFRFASVFSITSRWHWTKSLPSKLFPVAGRMGCISSKN
jgi:hypothetical protein